MNTSESFRALRRANPRTASDFTQAVDAAADTVAARIDQALANPAADRRPRRRTAQLRPRRRLVRASTAGALAAAAAVASALAVGWPGGTQGVESATAAVKRAATVTAASASRSGTAVVRITHDGQLWAAKTVRWNGADVEIAEDTPKRGLIVVDGTLYGPDPEGGWLELGSPESIDPDSGTTPAEHLAAVREDIGGVTLRRLTDGMTGLTTHRLEDGSAVYRGTVASGLIARETGFKEGQSIRVLPFGYVAHDEAADAAAPLDTALTVGADGIVRELAVTWGTDTSAWRYTVTYSSLGETAAPVAPANARSLLRLRARTR